MKHLIRGIVALVMLCFCANLNARSTTDYGAIVIEYIGQSDRPPIPIVISSSMGEAAWVRYHLFKEPIATLVEVYIVKDNTWNSIVDIALPECCRNLPLSPERGRTSPAIKLVMAKQHKYKELTINAQEGVRVLGAIQLRVSDYPSLVAQLGEIITKMNRVLKNHRQCN